ncbi:MAG: N-acetylgalactosamine 6-sulfate sulfatase [Bacteroidetes bacterium]|nr:MAG: N-acetylgalactosamine 6-sulfate sulfatase [Bacteroidota bacterium]
MGCQPGAVPSEAGKKPNVLFILTDDQGWGDLSLNGNTNLQTPHIDRLAAEGVVFDHFYVSPVCSPTRAEFLTGRYHPRTGVSSTSAGGERLDLDETTIAEVFQRAGYATAAYGKWHNGMQYPYHPNGRGFEDYYGFCSGHWGNYFSPVLEHNGRLVKGNGFIIDDLTEHAMSFMEQHQEDPFFLYLPFNTPHSPMQVPDRWWKKFEGKTLNMHHREPEKEDSLHLRAALALCENIDWNVGRLMARLEELGLAENTIVVYLSDNGPNGWRWNGGMKGRKGATDEGGVRSPTMIRWKGQIPAGQHLPHIAAAIDFLPTLSDLAGIPCQTQKPLDGISLKPLLLGQAAQWPERFIYNHWRGRTSVRSQQYRLDHENQLFDMQADPGQRTNVAAQLPEVAARLIAAKEKWVATVVAELPQADRRPFILGHPDAVYTQMPARDGIAHGHIQRSNRYPNCSFFTNWTSLQDSITWEAEVPASGNFEVVLYYTCKPEDVGARFELRFGTQSLQGRISQAHDPPLTGMEHDRAPRTESYVKDFKALELGSMQLEKGRGQLVLKALEIPGEEVMDFRLLMFKRL